MLARLLIILSLAWQPAALAAPTRASSPAPTQTCIAKTCCVLAAPTTCCSEPTQPTYECGACNGPCRCGIVPSDPPMTPDAPLPTEPTSPTLVRSGHQAIAAIILPAPANRSLRASTASPAAPITTASSLLCIWLT